MKTIVIETVTNGWLVRPFSGQGWAACDTPSMAVYNNLKDLQEDLPKLLEYEPIFKNTQPTK